jgi:hypothetical protein
VGSREGGLMGRVRTRAGMADGLGSQHALHDDLVRAPIPEGNDRIARDDARPRKLLYACVVSTHGHHSRAVRPQHRGPRTGSEAGRIMWK